MATTVKKWFGTDGIRGVVGEEPITEGFMARLGLALAIHAKAQVAADKKPCFILGQDTRISSESLSHALSSALIDANCDVQLAGVVPTPAIACLVRHYQADAGLVISASHNGWRDNGVKFFSNQGHKLSTIEEANIEEILYLTSPQSDAFADLPTSKTAQKSSDKGELSELADGVTIYFEHCLQQLAQKTEPPLHLVVDCANGATCTCPMEKLTSYGIKLTVLGNKPDGKNINLDCGTLSPQQLQQTVTTLGADLGVAFDGDGDRAIFVDHLGKVRDGDSVLYLLARYQQEYQGGCAGVVGTDYSSLSLEKALAQRDIPFHRVAVGDRNVSNALQESGLTLGGESSGHIVRFDKLPTGDGWLTALSVVATLREMGQSFAEVVQDLPDIKRVERSLALADCISLKGDATKQIITEAQISISDSGRVFVRPSGTEPILRILVESYDENEAEEMAENLCHRLKRQNLFD